MLDLDVVETSAIDEFHNDVRLAVFFAVAVDLNNVGIVDGSQGARFLQKLLNENTILADRLLHDLDGDRAAESFVIGLIDRTHAALAQRAKQNKVSKARRHAHFGAAGRTEDLGEGDGDRRVDRL